VSRDHAIPVDESSGAIVFLNLRLQRVDEEIRMDGRFWFFDLLRAIYGQCVNESFTDKKTARANLGLNGDLGMGWQKAKKYRGDRQDQN
jgi:hypothetical protein